MPPTGSGADSASVKSSSPATLLVLAALSAGIVGCSGAPEGRAQRCRGSGGAEGVELLSLTLNSSAVTGVRLWRLDEKTIARVPEWTAASPPSCCAAVYLRSEDPDEVRISCEVTAPVGLLRARYLTASTLGLGSSEVVAVGPGTGRRTLLFTHPRFPYVGAADGDLTLEYGATLDGPFFEFARVPTRVYAILGTPTAPWAAVTDSEENPHAPWLRALAVAARWAEGATTRDEAAARITRAVFALGRGPAPRLKWNGEQSHFCTPYSLFPSRNAFIVDCFYLSEFLCSLERGNGPPQCVNCNDVASVVCALSNLLGCDLSVVTLGVDRALTTKMSFRLGRVWPLGHDNRADGVELVAHQVAWSGSMSRYGIVYDACMALDEGEQPAPVCGLPFGYVSEKECYVSRLSVDAPFIILSGSQRRPVAPLRIQEVPRRGDR